MSLQLFIFFEKYNAYFSKLKKFAFLSAVTIKVIVPVLEKKLKMKYWFDLAELTMEDFSASLCYCFYLLSFRIFSTSVTRLYFDKNLIYAQNFTIKANNIINISNTKYWRKYRLRNMNSLLLRGPQTFNKISLSERIFWFQPSSTSLPQH